MDLLEKVNSTSKVKFATSQELLDFYKKVLKDRVGEYRLDEIGPIMSKGTDAELEGYMNKIFTFNGKTVDMTAGLDWYSAAEGDLEWNGGLVRQGYFMFLADAYEKTGDERYAATVIEHMLDYIRNVPVYDPEGKPYLEYKKSTWRPFEVAGRAGENWPVALAKVMTSKHMTPEAFLKIYWSIYEHAVFLRKHHWQHGNHACVEVAALVIIAMLYDTFEEADKWIDYGIAFLVDIWDELFYPDKYSNEMSGAYHWVAMRSFYGLMEVAMTNHYENRLPSIYRKRLELAGWAEYYQQKPDYSLPVTNDSNVGTQHQAQLIKIGKLIGEDYVMYRLTEGRCGKAPEHTSYFYPDARMGIMRSDWTHQAVYGSIDMGDWGTNHMNEDQLNFEVSAYGRNLLVNSGRWRYTTSMGVDWIEQARYFKSTASYNTVMVDGYNQMPANAEGKMYVYDDYDYVKGTFAQGYGEARQITDEKVLKATGQSVVIDKKVEEVVHCREIIFVKPGFFILRDTITGSKPHTASQIWHTNGAKMVIEGNTAYSQFGDANVIMIQLGTDVETTYYHGSEEPFRGWNCPKYDSLLPSAELAYQKNSSEKIVFETLIYPVRGKKIAGFPLFTGQVIDDMQMYTVETEKERYTVSYHQEEGFKLVSKTTK